MASRNKNRSGLKERIIGSSISVLSTCRLPSERDVLQRWMGLSIDSAGHLSRTRSNASIAADISEEVVAIWERASIPTIRSDKVKPRIMDMLARWEKVRRLEESHPKCITYAKSLDQLFNIAPADVEKRLESSSNPNHVEDLAFYKAQLKDTRSSSMACVDTKLSTLEQRRQQRKKDDEMRRQREQARIIEVAQATGRSDRYIFK